MGTTRPLSHPLRWITVFGLGHMRPASGTWGSLPAPVIGTLLVFADMHPGNGQTGTLVFHAVMALIFIVFAWGCVKEGDHAESRWGHDPAEAVADEASAQALLYMGLPAMCYATTWHALGTLAAGFFLFRILDIIKPFPAFRLQSIAGGWGILLDDVMSAAYGLVIMQVTSRGVLGWV